jgi:hypothetical protein
VRTLLTGTRSLLRGIDEGPADVEPLDTFGLAGMVPR